MQIPRLANYDTSQFSGSEKDTAVAQLVMALHGAVQVACNGDTEAFKKAIDSVGFGQVNGLPARAVSQST